MTDVDDPVPSKLNTLPKYVASRTLDEVSWSGSKLVQHDLIDVGSFELDAAS